MEVNIEVMENDKVVSDRTEAAHEQSRVELGPVRKSFHIHLPNHPIDQQGLANTLWANQE